MTPSEEPLDVQQINAAITTGGEGYWRCIYQTYFGPLKTFLARRFGPLPPDMAEELAYRTLLKLVNGKRRPQFGDKRQFVAWLYKAARCSALDYWRSSEGKAERCTDRYECPDDLALNLPEAADEAATHVQGEVEAVLARLSERERTLLAMRANGTAYSEIARELGVAENAARTYFDRAKRRFRKLYIEMVREVEP